MPLKLTTPVARMESGWLAQALFSRYVLPFEVAALILTVAIVAAIPLTLRHQAGTRRQNPARQVKVSPEERVRLVKMAATRPTPPPEAAP